MQSRVKNFMVLCALVMFMGAYTWADSVPSTPSSTSDPVVDIEQGLDNNFEPPFPGIASFTVSACGSASATQGCSFDSPQFFNDGPPISELEITINTFDAVDASGNPIEPDNLDQEPWVAAGNFFHLVSQTPTSAVFAINQGVSPICSGDGQTTCPFFVSFQGVFIPENGAAIVTLQTVPEPASSLLLAGALPLFWIRSRLRKAR